MRSSRMFKLHVTFFSFCIIRTSFTCRLLTQYPKTSTSRLSLQKMQWECKKCLLACSILVPFLGACAIQPSKKILQQESGPASFQGSLTGLPWCDTWEVSKGWKHKHPAGKKGSSLLRDLLTRTGRPLRYYSLMEVEPKARDCSWKFLRPSKS